MATTDGLTLETIVDRSGASAAVLFAGGVHEALIGEGTGVAEVGVAGVHAGKTIRAIATMMARSVPPYKTNLFMISLLDELSYYR